MLHSPPPRRDPDTPRDSPVVCISDEEGDDDLEEDLGDVFDVKEEPAEDVASSQDLFAEDDPYMSLLVPDDPPGQVSTEEAAGRDVGVEGSLGGGEAKVVAKQHLAPQTNMISKPASIAQPCDDKIEEKIQALK